MPAEWDTYPIPVSPPPGVTAPQVVSPGAEHHLHCREKYAVLASSGDDGGSQQSVRSDAVILRPLSTDGLPADAEATGPRSNYAAAEEKSKLRYCGLSRRKMWILGAVIAFILVGAIVGGVLGGILGKERKDSTAAPLTPDAQQHQNRAIAVSNLKANEASGNYQIFYQDLNTTDIRYRIVLGDAAAGEQNATLKIRPNANAALAAVARDSSETGQVAVHLYYVSTSEAGDICIAEAIMNCVESTGKCTTSFNTIVTVMKDISPATKLAAVIKDNGKSSSSVQVFFQAHMDYIWVLQGTVTDGDAAAKVTSNWTVDQVGGGQAVEGSSIAATPTLTTNTTLVFFIHSRTGRLRGLPSQGETISLAGGDHNDGTIIKVDDTPLPNWNTDARLAACHNSMPGTAAASDKNSTTYRVYYASTSTHEIVEYTNTQGSFNGTWSKPNKGQKKWGEPQGNLAAVSSDNGQVRLVYEQDGKLARNMLQGINWSKTSFFS
ncbi:hypothetical protein PG984_006582 [Apiospora sp. TS-2023a]